LLKSEPVPPSPEQVQQSVIGLAEQAKQQMIANPGAPMPPPPDVNAISQQLTQPSVPIDPVWDFHQQHVQTIQDWLASQERFDEEAKGNFAGIENVKLHGMEHKKVLQSQQGPGQQKPPSASINFKDLPPDGKIQLAQEAGISLNPALMMAQQAAEAQKPAMERPNA
jgi:hypothetical protein